MTYGPHAFRVAWARYGENGFVLANSLSRTHIVAPGGAKTLCGMEIPTRRHDNSLVYGNAAGSGECGNCKRASRGPLDLL